MSAKKIYCVIGTTAYAEPKNICVACGIDISTAKGRRLLRMEVSNDVKVFWSELFSEDFPNTVGN